MTASSTTGHDAGPVEVTVPQLGDFTDIPVIEILVAEGDSVSENDPLVTLESDKATMEVPAPHSGTVHQLHVRIGDRVSVGSPLLSLNPAATADDAGPDLVAHHSGDLDQQEPGPAEVTAAASAAATSAAAHQPAAPASPPADRPAGREPHAGPGVRRLARELDVDLASIAGTGPKGRIVKEDLLAALPPAAGPATPSTSPATGIPEIPVPDFSAYGPVETRPLSRITKRSGPFLHRSWLNVPHVTHNDHADITALDQYRRELDADARSQGYRVTLLSFLLKACAATLREYPQVNSSLTADKESLVVKGYYHLGVAVDTPDGLVVPVLRDVDRKGITELSRELGELSGKAREGKLSAGDMQGGTFTISSLGGIGGTSFTPIVNAPEAAILGVVRAVITPVWNGRKFKPRLMLPLSLSYDHRIIDGALAARFTRSLCERLEDVRRMLL